jgi:preprotein translocase SecE subunit
MNREMKRAQERAERAQKRGGTDRGATAAAPGTRRAPQKERRERTGARQFLKEVRQELVTYTVVVLATIVVVTAYVAGLDYVFTRAILNLLD